MCVNGSNKYKIQKCNFFSLRKLEILFFERGEKNNNSRVTRGEKCTFYRLIRNFIYWSPSTVVGETTDFGLVGSFVVSSGHILLNKFCPTTVYEIEFYGIITR